MDGIQVHPISRQVVGEFQATFQDKKGYADILKPDICGELRSTSEFPLHCVRADAGRVHRRGLPPPARPLPMPLRARGRFREPAPPLSWKATTKSSFELAELAELPGQP